MLSIKILGTGCPNCRRLEAAVRQGVDYLGGDADIVEVTDIAQITSYPILSTPGLVINEQVVSAGRVPSQGEILTLLTTALEVETGAQAPGPS